MGISAYIQGDLQELDVLKTKLARRSGRAAYDRSLTSTFNNATAIAMAYGAIKTYSRTA